MNTEQQIFNTLENRCREPGFLEVISFLCWRDTFIHQESENMGIKDILKGFDLSRLSRTELSTLIGLLCKNGITNKKLSEMELQSNVEEIDSLMKDLHQAMMFENINLDEILTNPDFLKSGSLFREAIFYAGDGAYKHQYRDLAKVRYAKDNRWIKENKGFAIDDVIRVFTTMDQLHINKANSINLNEQGFSRIFRFTLDELVSQLELDLNTVKNVISAFSSPAQKGMESFNSIDDFNHRNAYPIIDLGNDEFISFQSYSIWESLYESPFFWFDTDKAYTKIASDNRGAFTEDFTAERLALVFDQKNVYKNINIYKGKKIVGEIDVLVTFGKYALVIQAKSKKLTIAARKGNSQKLEDDFKKAVHNAYDQALECSGFLQDPDVILKQDNAVLDIGSNSFDCIFPICIISDYYPALAAQAREFLDIKTTEIIKHPYVMDVFLLDLIVEMLDSPLFFLDFLEKRCDFGLALLANHELTILSTYIKQNLYFEDHANMIMLDESLSGDLELSMLSRREGFEAPKTPEGLLLLEHKYEYIGGLLNQIKYSDNFIDQKIGFLLLSLSGDTLAELDGAINQMVQAFHYGKKHSDFTIGVSEGKTGLTIHCNDKELFSANQILNDHCKLRKYSNEAALWIGLVYSPSELKLRLGQYHSDLWVPDDKMDKLVGEKKTRTTQTSNFIKNINQFMQPPVQINKKFGRNDQCPCGSGKKYKKCCL